MTARDYYEILSITRTATADEVRKAHRKLALQLHPDRNKSKDAPARFNEVQEAYEVLSDADKRKRYDEFIRLGGSPGSFASSCGRCSISRRCCTRSPTSLWARETSRR